ncbi:hypothetical protein RE6C_00660 [Rhodopirellula europaea 6C]|uniref:Uncharacterized protein n=1 Tax=Rhodopirellula europaea 6C TaxID=1263867 RepID=M2A938_9BACT|nr:hypothetical protein RE6C_00660 [Rhodopirellula europaea 6C]
MGPGSTFRQSSLVARPPQNVIQTNRIDSIMKLRDDTPMTLTE